MRGSGLDKRSQFSGIFLFLGSVAILVALIAYLMFPDQYQFALGILGTAAVLIIAAVAIQPRLPLEIIAQKKTLLWIIDAFFILAMIGVGVLLSYIGFRRNIRYDFTREKLFSVSDATVAALRNLRKEVTVTAFFATGSDPHILMENLLREYKRHSEKFQCRIIDPLRDPVTTEAMKVSNYGLVVQCGNSRRDIPIDRIIAMPSPMSGQVGASQRFHGEQALTSALLNVTSGRRKKIQFVTGHGEAGINVYDATGYAAMHELLSRENFAVDEVNLMQDAISSDASILAIISPQSEFHESEIRALDSFITGSHGNLLITLDPDSKSGRFEEFITRHFGIIANEETVIDPRTFDNVAWYIVPEFVTHPIISPMFEKNLLTLLFHCRGFSYEKKDGWKVAPVLKTTEAAYAKRNPEDVLNKRFQFNPSFDVHGPLNLALAVERNAAADKGDPAGTADDAKDHPAPGSKIVLFGDSDFASNKMFNEYGNKDLFINAINWLAGQEEMISIRPKEVELSRIILEADSANRLFYLCILVSPLIILVIGGGVWLTRRRSGA